MGTLCLYISPAACPFATWVAPWSQGQRQNGLSLAKGKTYMIVAAVSWWERFQISGRPSSQATASRFCPRRKRRRCSPPGLASASFSFLLLLFSTLNQHIHRNNRSYEGWRLFGPRLLPQFLCPLRGGHWARDPQLHPNPVSWK